MVTTLIMSAKLTTPGLLKIKIFQNKGYDIILTMTSTTKFYDMTHIILQIWSCAQSLVTLAFP